MNGFALPAMGCIAVVCTLCVAWMAASVEPRVKGRASHLVLTALAGAALVAVLMLRFRFLGTAAAMIPLCTLYLRVDRRIGVCEALYMACVFFLVYDLAVLLSSQAAAWIAPLVPGVFARNVILVAGASAIMVAGTWAVRRWAVGGDYRLSRRQSLLILIPLVPYLYIRSGVYIMAFNGWIAAPYHGEMVLILLSYVPTVVVMVCVKNALNGQIQRNDVLRMREMLTMQHQQYLVKRETIALMNKKYHDMRHFADVMARGATVGERERNDFERDLAGCALFVDTGCPIVDVILVDKITLCTERGIRLVPYVDARALDFMGPLDLCTLFGNALDNAIAATALIGDPAEREIKVRVQQRGALVVLTFENPYVPGMSALETLEPGSVPLPDAQSGHGYGMGNMRAVVESYGGALSYTVRDGMCTLVLMVPLPREGSGAAGCSPCAAE